MSRHAALAVAALATSALLACGDDGTGPGAVLSGVTIANAVDTLGIADTLRLDAVARDANDVVVDAPVMWRSLSPALATVSETGLLTGIDSGDARVVVTARGRTTVADTVLVRVRPLPHAFELSGIGDTAYVNVPVTVGTTVMDGRGLVMPTPRLRWSSSDTTVLTVDSLGRVTGRELGSAWLRVEAGRARDSVRIPVDYRRVATPAPFVQYAGQRLPTDACGITSAGVLWCGAAPVATSARFTDVQHGQNVTCGLATDSTSYCWGSNAHGQFGNDTRAPTSSSVPVRAHGGRKLRRLAVGDHLQTCAIQAADSVVYCVGHNDFGQVGRLPVSGGDTLFAPITGSLKALDLDITGFHGCAISLDGSLWCWGDADFLGNAPVIPPTQLTPPNGYVQVATVSGAGACMRKGDGTVDCYIGNQLRRVETGARFVTIVEAAGGRICGLTAAGEMWCWDQWRSTTATTIPARRIAPGRTYASIGWAWNTCMIDAQQRTYCF